jgi:predicted lysophospholipase L1 biosynthesis ABC-type transport system permease subunit
VLGHDVGDEITVKASGPLDADGNPSGPPFESRLKIVGVAVSPAVGLAGTDTPRLDEGILLRSDITSGRVFAYGAVALFDLASGTDPAVVKAHFPDGLPDDVGAETEWFESAKPAEVVQSQRALGVLAIAVVAMLVGVLATIGLSLFSFVRERRAGFAVLKAIGFQPRQIRTAVLAQAGVVAGTGLLVALPLGTVAGRWLYQAFAEDIGVVVEPIVPIAPVAGAAAAIVALVYVVALLPARLAKRVSVARDLRAE